MPNNSFVFYESFYTYVQETLRKRKGDKEALDFLAAIIEYGLYGVVPDETSDLWLYNLRQEFELIDRAKERYNAAVENGKKGGRPKKITPEEVAAAAQTGMTNKEIAEQYQVSERTVRRAKEKDFVF